MFDTSTTAPDGVAPPNDWSVPSWWVDDGPAGSVPEVPGWMLARDQDPDYLEHLERSYEEYAVEKARMDPRSRFEREYGLDRTRPDPLTAFERAYGDRGTAGCDPEVAAVTKATARFRQDEAEQLARVRWVADAERVRALLVAYEDSMDDLAVRFGASFGRRGGLGAQAFFKSMALATLTNPFRVAHEVDTGITLRDRLPVTWARFQDGQVPWERVDLVVKQADGLAEEHWPAYDTRACHEPPRRVRRLRPLGRMGSCLIVVRPTRPSCGSGQFGWWPSRLLITGPSGRR